MTKKKIGGAKGGAKKLKLKKETVKDLDPKAKGKGVKGGYLGTAYPCGPMCTYDDMRTCGFTIPSKACATVFTYCNQFTCAGIAIK